MQIWTIIAITQLNKVHLREVTNLNQNLTLLVNLVLVYSTKINKLKPTSKIFDHILTTKCDLPTNVQRAITKINELTLTEVMTVDQTR